MAKIHDLILLLGLFVVFALELQLLFLGFLSKSRNTQNTEFLYSVVFTDGSNNFSFNYVIEECLAIFLFCIKMWHGWEYKDYINLLCETILIESYFTPSWTNYINIVSSQEKNTVALNISIKSAIFPLHIKFELWALTQQLADYTPLCQSWQSVSSAELIKQI